jgi:EmrB/QacA subfamily drug resistance transporter
MRRARLLTLAATSLGSSIAFLDATIVIVALPRIEEDLGLGLSGQQWVVLGYALALSALYLPTGAIGDRVGLRRMFVGGTVVFAGASMLCALADSEAWLVAGRSLQGVGGAALTTTSLALLRVTWAGSEGRAIGLWTSFTSIATIGGPALGGLLVSQASWRWIFLVNVPLAIVVVVLALAGRVEGERSVGRGTLDLVGSALAMVGLVGVSFGLVEAQTRSPAVAGGAALIGLASLGALAAWTLRAPEPLVPPRLLRRPGLAAANVVTLVIYAALAAHLLFLPVYLQFLGLSPLVSGLAFSLPSIGLVLLAPAYGRLADRIGPRRPIALGCLGVAGSVLLLLPVADRHGVWTWGVVALTLFAIALPAVVAPITAAALAPAPADLAGVASGLNQTSARAGGVLSVAAVGALAAWVFSRGGGLGDAPFDPDLVGISRDAGIETFRVVVVSISGIAALGAVLAATLLRDRVERPGGSEQGALESQQRDLPVEPAGVADE